MRQKPKLLPEAKPQYLEMAGGGTQLGIGKLDHHLAPAM
jgi:hypothetical protein